MGDSNFGLFHRGYSGLTHRPTHATCDESSARNTSLRGPSVCAQRCAVATLLLRRDVSRIKKLTYARNSRARLKGSAKLISHTHTRG